MSFIQYFTGFLFLVSGWVKAVDPLGTAYKMEQYFAEFEIAFEGSWFSFLAPVFPWLSGLAIGFSVFMIIFEIVLGFMIIIGAFPRLTSWAFFLLILFFTALTGFTYLTGYVPSGENFFNFSSWQAYNPNNMRVTDCGCFGDFIKLEPKISFFKDIVLLLPALLFLLFTRKMHQWGSPLFHRYSIAAFTIILFVYSLSNYVWDLPHIDFRPFREGVNVAETKEREDEALANVQVLAFKLKDKASGEVIEVSYSDYLAGISSQYSSDKYEVSEQVKSDPEIEATKISDFEFLDAEGNDMTEDFLQDPGYKLLLVGHKLKYDVEPIIVKVQDTIFTYDTVWIGGEDSMEMIISKNVASVSEREEQQYRYTFDPDFLEKWRTASKLADHVSKKGVRVLALAGGAGQDPILAFIREIGANFPVYEADDILLKTIIRSNPGYVAWKGGEIIKKWHFKKVDAEELEKVFRD
jgi:uncharacterized membrane protein YphA (DoxX/SURF4 family)